VKAKPGLWAPYADRLALWGMKTPAEAKDLPFVPAVLIADGI
jgi:glycerophosphoryl diester phosphodiesterase